MPNKHTKERLLKLLDYEKGFTTKDIAMILNCHYVTAAKLLNELYHSDIVEEKYYDYNYRVWKLVEEGY